MSLKLFCEGKNWVRLETVYIIADLIHNRFISKINKSIFEKSQEGLSKIFQVELTVGKNLKYRIREFVNVCSDHYTEQHANN